MKPHINQAQLFAIAAGMLTKEQLAKGGKVELTKEQYEKLIAQVAEKRAALYVKKQLAKGLKCYEYDGQTVWALNEKNGRRKAAAKAARLNNK